MIKKFFLAGLFTILVAVLGANIIALDDASVNDKGLLDSPEFANEKNGYVSVAYMYQDDFSVFSSKELKMVKKILDLKKWDQETVMQILKDKQGIMDDVAKSIEKEGFQAPPIHTLTDINALQVLPDIARLYLLQAFVYLRQGDYDRVFDVLNTIIVFVETTRSHDNVNLVTYFLADIVNRMLLERLHWVVSTADFDREDYIEFIGLLNTFSEYHEDNFDRVIAGEYRFTSLVIKDMNGMSFQSRLESYQWRKENPGESQSIIDFASPFIVYDYFQPN